MRKQTGASAMSRLVKGVRIYPVPARLVPEMWIYLVPHLMRGSVASHRPLDDLAAGIAAGTDRVWAIFLNGSVTAAFVTAIHDDEQGRWLSVFGLGGRHIRAWANALDATMQLEAKANSANVFRFAGRVGWSRVLPNLSVIGRAGDHLIYERAAA
jgi:hypothetical protein